MNLDALNSAFSLVKTPELFGRYITNFHIEKCLKKIPKSYVKILGYSVENRPIYALKFGRGSKKVLMWSQMHGNESTTTKALFDCFRLFESNNALSKSILEHCTLMVVPILNPDGAERYTRLNANSVDLNRDAQDLSQPESKVLQSVFKSFKPDYCFNLHGQRTIYSVGDSNNSATLSFLSPAQDESRSLTNNRKVAMAIIVKINELLQAEIPSSVGRYDDSFNLNCVGDTFQSFGVPTLLYETGHYPNDYNREEVRRLAFVAILRGLEVISKGIVIEDYKAYFNIPENGKYFYDIIIRNVRLNEGTEAIVDIAIQYEEILINNRVKFVPKVKVISKLNGFYGHREIDAKSKVVKSKENSELKIGSENDFVVLENEKIVLNL